MKYKTIEDIVNTVECFYDGIINPKYTISWSDFEQNCKNECAEMTMQDDGTCDVDYFNMCFTVYKEKDGTARLCENASYYIIKNGFLDTDDSVIDVELF